MRRRLLPSFICAALLLGCAPAGFAPESWDSQAAPAPVGPLASNEALRAASLIAEGQLDEPEDVAVDLADPRQPIFTGVPDGRILKVDWAVGGRAHVTTVARPGGVPLGLKMAPDGKLIVADGGVGLLSIDTRDPGYPVTVLTRAIGSRAFHLLNDVDIAHDGTIYFSESSPQRYSAEGFGPLYAVLEAKAEGALFSYDPKTHETRQLCDGLCFANGVAVEDDQQSVLVVETSRYRIRRVWVKGPRTGQSDLFADNVPGSADGIMGDGRGRYWVAMNGRRSALADFAGPRPWVRSLAAMLPGATLLSLAVGERVGLVVAYDGAGKVIRSLEDTSGRFEGGLANVEPYGDNLYLGTKWGHHVGVVPLPR